MSIKKIKDFPDGSGALSNDDIFIFMDDPSGSGVTKKISFSLLSSSLGGGAVSSFTSSQISNFNTSVSGLLPVKNIIGSGNINVNNFNGVFTVSSSGLVQSNTVGIAGASGINNLVQISQASYDALSVKNPNTVYFII